MTALSIRPAGWPASPIRHSEVLDRPLRQDGPETLGISTQTWIEVAVDEGHWELALELTEYFAHEISIMNQVLYTWLTDILDYRLGRAGATEEDMGDKLLRG